MSLFENYTTLPLYTISKETQAVQNSYIRSIGQKAASIVSLGFGALLTVVGCLIFVLATNDPYPVQVLAFVITGLGIISAIGSFILLFCSVYYTKSSVYGYMGLSQQYLCAACCDFYCNNFAFAENQRDELIYYKH